jgi:hypothetical protein
MKIILQDTAAGGKEYILCHGGVLGIGKHVGPSGLLISVPIRTQIAEAIGAEAAVPVSRKNRSTRLSFSVSVECETTQAAEWMTADYESTIPRSGRLLLLADPEAGGAVKRKKITYVTIDDPKTECIGRTVIITYAITGSRIESY